MRSRSSRATPRGFRAGRRPVPAGALTLSAAFIRAARVPDRVAVRSGDRRITYAQLDHESRRLARALLAGGECGAGDRVGVLLGNTPEFLVTVLALARAGLVALPIPTGGPLIERRQRARRALSAGRGRERWPA